MIKRIAKEIANDITNLYSRSKWRIKKWLIGKLGGNIYHIQGETPKTVDDSLLSKGDSTEIVVNIAPFNTGSIIEIKGNVYRVLGYSLKVVKHDK